jgi:hypothetical protein
VTWKPGDPIYPHPEFREGAETPRYMAHPLCDHPGQCIPNRESGECDRSKTARWPEPWPAHDLDEQWSWL